MHNIEFLGIFPRLPYQLGEFDHIGQLPLLCKEEPIGEPTIVKQHFNRNASIEVGLVMVDKQVYWMKWAEYIFFQSTILVTNSHQKLHAISYLNGVINCLGEISHASATLKDGYDVLYFFY